MRTGGRRCAFIGDESLVIDCASLAMERGLEAVVIASRLPKALEFARARGIAAIDLAQPDLDLAAAFGAHGFDILISAAYLHILPEAILQQARCAINFHDGPLPAYAGLNVTTWAIWNGETHHGVTWHLMTAAADAGPVLAEDAFPIAPDETAFSLNLKCYQAALATFTKLADDLAAGSLTPRPQASGPRRLYRRSERPLVLFDPARTAAELERAVRALDVGQRADNGVGRLRLVLADEALIVESLAIEASTPDAGVPRPVAGKVLGQSGDTIRIALAAGEVVSLRLSDTSGTRLDARALAARSGLAPGAVIAPPAPLLEGLKAHDPALARQEPWWRDQLAAAPAAAPVSLFEAEPPGDWNEVELSAPGAAPEDLACALGLWISGLSGTQDCTLSISDPATRAQLKALGTLAWAPVASLACAPERAYGLARAETQASLGRSLGHGVILKDLLARTPRPLFSPSTAQAGLDLEVGPGEVLPTEGLVRIAVSQDGRIRLRHRLSADAAKRVCGQLEAIVQAGLAAPEAPLGSLPLIGPLDAALLEKVNQTRARVDADATIDGLFLTQAGLTPQAPALSFGDQTLTYADLERRVRALAKSLVEAGVGQGDIVGVALERGPDMVASVLAILSLGCAYLPLDPAYPADRLAFMVEDSAAAVIVGRRPLSGASEAGPRLIDPAEIGEAPPHGTASARPQHGAGALAYLIYTSGSTGRPKGVEIAHGSVINFFAGMDQVIAPRGPVVWLAVTSLSFDISVLELLWTLCRGHHVVIRRENRPQQRTAEPALARPASLSLFYFAAGSSQAGDSYRLLLEGARFADANGFEAVWTPERHFHDFGAAYPNPSVVSAAIAATTRRVAIRAGSVVLPLHSPVRVAEEWAVVDNLSNGRVGIAFAAGWQPRDFALNPQAYGSARDGLPDMIDAVRRLWRGESLDLPGPNGEPLSVATLPRPLQAELPVWLTSAGTPASFERAGRLGLNVLTHLLGQSVPQLAANIALYRKAWREAGHRGEGRVSLMLHTFLDSDAERARRVAREPLISYLGAAAGLIKDLASAFPTFARSGMDADAAFRSLSPEEMRQLQELAADRYLSTSGLFGTPDDAMQMVEAVTGAGVDEIACLIDFGIETQTVLDSLALLADLGQRMAARAPVEGDGLEVEAEETFAGLVSRHGITHLQCTPSLLAMLLADPADRAALGNVGHLLVGGEALPPQLLAELRQVSSGRLTNMYGPTETTIWSLSWEAPLNLDGPVLIGAPIANTTIHVLDPAGRPLPVGAAGELHIGGAGLARGYHKRPELTAERFVERPGLGRVYGTGDLVRVRADGQVSFLGRVDDQVKIRGHRIEPGEIEAVLDAHPAVARSAVVASQGTTPALIAYASLRPGEAAAPEALREHLKNRLPEPMTPAKVVLVDALPLTPNGKVDRKQLSRLAAEPANREALAPSASEAGAGAALVRRVWSEELGAEPGLDDNFFDIGGHSLLAVKVFRRLSEATGAPIALTDVFRYPTVRAFAARLDTLGSAMPRASAPGAGTGQEGPTPGPQAPVPGRPAAPGQPGAMGGRAALRRQAMLGRSAGGQG